jgi:uncharacterized protein YdeI (YjbR/CyaY-like superfamily)
MFSPQVDLKIASAPEFAQPILEHLREIVHKYCPEAVEKIKWQFPCFEYKGKILCNMAAFKEHCVFGFWQAKLLTDTYGILKVTEGSSNLGNLGKLTDISQIPEEEVLGTYIIEAMMLIEKGIKGTVSKKEVQTIETPSFILINLMSSPQALATYEALSNSCKKEYIDWIIEAKREETKSKRMETMLEWLEEGKSRNWKYQK